MSRRALGLLCLVACSPGRDAVVPRVDAARPAPVVDAAPRLEPDAARLTLHQAAARCAADRIAELLGGGAEADPRDGEGRTPLHVATGRCTVDVVRRFVAAGADVRTVGNDGMTPLHEAAAPTLNGVGAYAIWTAGDVEVVRFLIEKGADPRATTPTGWTALHAAAQLPRGGTEVVAALLDGGARLDARDRNGWTPLHVAARYDAVDVARLLRARGAALDAKTTVEMTVKTTVYRAGSTPLDVARAGGSTRVVELLER